jgi:hypothetical protein
MKYTDPEGDFVLTACLIAAGVGILVDYGFQEAFNYVENWNKPEVTLKDIWLTDIDWFDVALSGTISGLTAGYSASIKAGESAGKFGTALVKYSKFVKAGEILATSAIDITGNGWQKVELDDFSKRVLVAGVTWGATEIVGNLVKPKPKPNLSYDLSPDPNGDSGLVCPEIFIQSEQHEKKRGTLPAIMSQK